MRTIVISLTSLDAVFTTVAARVGATRMADTGILVARARAGGWVAVVTDRTSPQTFTINRCRATDQGVS